MNSQQQAAVAATASGASAVASFCLNNLPIFQLAATLVAIISGLCASYYYIRKAR